MSCENVISVFINLCLHNIMIMSSVCQVGLISKLYFCPDCSKYFDRKPIEQLFGMVVIQLRTPL